MKKLSVFIITAFRSLTLILPQMKAVNKIFVLFIVLSSITWIAPQKANAQVSVSFQVFYDNLSPYGNWIDNSDYGYVWVPRISHGFIPYGTNGYWIFTNEGWTWVSNYSWGWAPFHYGRWFYDYYYGWVWVPDNKWGPGWVIWRKSEGYYGWAPIGPGVSIDFAYSSGYRLPNDHWRFVRDRDFGRTDINNYYVSTSNYTTIISNSTVINNFREDRTRSVKYNEGPERTDVERRAAKTFAPVAIKESTRPAQNLRNDQLEMYRPRVQNNVSAEQEPVPSKVVGWRGKQQPTEQQHSDQQARQQQQQRNDQQAKEQQQQRNDQLAKEQQQQRSDQQAKQQQQQHNDQQANQQQQQQHNDKQGKQQPIKEKPSQSQKNNPSKKVEG